MKTPFDTVLRIRRREIDETRIALQAKTTQLVELDRRRDALEQELARETEACHQSWSASAEAFIKLRKAQRELLDAQRAAISADVEQLRRKAVDAYGAQHVLENAADAFCADHQRRQAQIEQREADDMCAARHIPLMQRKIAPETLAAAAQ